MQLPIGLTFNAHPDRTVSVENVINMQPEATPHARGQYVLRSCPDLGPFVGLGGDKAVRGMIEVRGLLYVVAGPVLSRINSDRTVDKFTYIDGAGPVGISTNGKQIHIAAGDAGFIFDVESEALTPISDPEYPKAFTSAFVAGRFVVEDAESQGKFYWSDQYDGLAWNGLDFATAELLPDPVVAVYGRGQTLTVFGSQTVEFWRPSEIGFSPITGSGQRMGLRSRASVAEVDNVIFYHASDGSVRAMSGYQPQRISTPNVEAAISEWTDAEAFTYALDGHTVYQISSPSYDRTFCYDLTESQRLGLPVWFERRSGVGQTETRHRGRFSAVCFGKTLVGDTQTGVVWELSSGFAPQFAEFYTPHLADPEAHRRMKLNRLELVCRTGQTAVLENGGWNELWNLLWGGGELTREPKCMLSLSRDNGFEWGESKWRRMGRDGEHDLRLIWRRLGQFRQVACHFRMTQPVPFVVIGVNADVR
ncbi:MAG: hypothetical protein ACPH3N_00740 [Alcanivorax sediminis]|uniref:hypothetical protein n=1 Tax=Alcanivorax sediminis TaxID=2663008 RepID=UPI003C3CB66B